MWHTLSSPSGFWDTAASVRLTKSGSSSSEDMSYALELAQTDPFLFERTATITDFWGWWFATLPALLLDSKLATDKPEPWPYSMATIFTSAPSSSPGTKPTISTSESFALLSTLWTLQSTFNFLGSFSSLSLKYRFKFCFSKPSSAVSVSLLLEKCGLFSSCKPYSYWIVSVYTSTAVVV